MPIIACEKCRNLEKWRPRDRKEAGRERRRERPTDRKERDRETGKRW